MNSTENVTASSTHLPGNFTDDVPVGWIMAAQTWAWTVSCVGSLGNLLTISTILHQLYLGRVCRSRCTNYLIQCQMENGYIRRGCGGNNNINSNNNNTYGGNVSIPCSRRLDTPSRPVVVLEGDTLLLLHLSICDFLYCTVNLPLTAITYSNGYQYIIGETDSPPSKTFCTGAALFRYVNALAEWTTLGLLTVQRCVDLGRSRGTRFFKPRPTLFFIMAIWVFSFLLQLPSLIEYTYDASTYKCDMKCPKPRLYFYTLESLLPCILMFTGCLSIIYQIYSNTRKLRAAGMPQELVKQRFRRMLKTSAMLLALLFLFLFCVIPICVYNVYNVAMLLPLSDCEENEEKESNPNVPLGIAIFMVYWIQYAVNFLVYAASNPNYRKAYKQLFLSLSVVGRNCFSKTRWRGSKNSKMSRISSSIIKTCTFTKMTLSPHHNSDNTPGSHPFPFHTHDLYPSGAHLLNLQRLRSFPMENSDHLPAKKFLEGEKKFNTLPAGGLQFWFTSPTNNGSQSSRSSVITLESIIVHKTDAEGMN